MAKTDPRVDAYIAKSAEFARPILEHVRALVHAACPDVEETIKWRMPFFVHKGPICYMAAFKEHCAVGLWKASSIMGEAAKDEPDDEKGAGQFGRITKVSDLPSKKVLTGYIKKAMDRNAEGVKAPPRVKKPPKALVMPDELTRALQKNAKARAAFEAFPPSHKREYTEWIAEAKTETTRARRIETALEWMAEGKSRNWKYKNC